MPISSQPHLLPKNKNTLLSNFRGVRVKKQTSLPMPSSKSQPHLLPKNKNTLLSNFRGVRVKKQTSLPMPSSKSQPHLLPKNKNTLRSNFRGGRVKMRTSLPMPSSKVSLKLFVHKTSNQVLFAEAGKEFVDFFSNILLLPVGTLITILKPEVVFASLGNIHEGIVNLSKSFGRCVRPDLIHFPPNGVKESLYLVKNNLELKPLSTASIILLLDEFHVKEGDLEEIVVDLGEDEGLKLLMASLQSRNVLTDAFLPKVKPEV